MKKYYNVLFPIWLILIFPPIIFILIPGNFIIDSLVLLIGMAILKLSNRKKIYSQNIMKIVIIGFLSDIIGSLLLLLTLFFRLDFIEDISQAISWNPFTNVFAVFYILFAIFISALLIFIFNKKYCFKELEEKSRKYLSLMIAILTAPYIFLMPSQWLYDGGYSYNVEDDKGISLVDSNLQNVIDYMPISSYVKNYKVENNSLIININNTNEEMIYIPYYQIEESVSIIFNIVKDVKNVQVNTTEKNYYFSLGYINQIYGDVFLIENAEIINRYKDKNFEEYEYFGYVNGYNIFDFSKSCTGVEQKLYEDSQYIYKVECSSVEDLYLVNNVKIKIIDALNNNTITIDDLINTSLKITEELK